MKRKGFSPKDAVVLGKLGQIKALADPIRYRVFERLTRQAETAKQAADAMGIKPTSLYHHFAVLEKAGLIRKVRTRKVRGTVEKYYEAVSPKIVLSPDLFGGGELPLRSISAAAFQSTIEEISEVETRASERGEAPPILLHRLRIRTTPDKSRELEEKLQAWIAECESAAIAEGGAEYGVTVALYEILDEPLKEDET